MVLSFWSCTDDDYTEPEEREYTCVFWTSPGDRTIEKAIFEHDSLIERKIIYKGERETAPSAIAVDASMQTVYWTDYAMHQVLRMDWDGAGGPDVLYTTPLEGTGPVELAIDPVQQQLYWTHPFDDLIVRAPAGGGEAVDTLFSSDDGVNGAWGIGVQVANGYLFWVEYIDIELYRVPIDMSAPPGLLYAGGSGFLRPYGLAVSESSNSLFIADNPLPGNGKPDRLLRGSTDGVMSLQEMYTMGEVDNAYNIVIIPEENEVYWHNQLTNGSIYRGSMDGTAPATLLIDNINIGEGLAVVKVKEEFLPYEGE